MKRPSRNRLVKLVLALFAAQLVWGCEGADIEYNYPRTGANNIPTYEKHVSVFGGDGISLLDAFQPGGVTGDQGGGQGAGIGVNSFLWRASLDAISFMPLQSADPFGGVIITDWYGPPNIRSERFKVSIFILDRALRSDGIRAKVFKQTKDERGEWTDADNDERLDRELEDTILTKARELRVKLRPSTK